LFTITAWKNRLEKDNPELVKARDRIVTAQRRVAVAPQSAAQEQSTKQRPDGV
jgi:hypothetical protein